MNTPASPTDIAIAKLIKAQMSVRDMTQVELANITGITKSQVNRKLTGKGHFELDDILAMSEAVELDPQKLIARGIELAHADPEHFSILEPAPK